MYPEPVILLITIFAGLFGAVVGSFLNVCIHRLPKNISIIYPNSHCIECGKMLAWYDNIPIVSWICLGGACRYCRIRISSRYIFIEALTGALFILYTRLIVLTPLPCFATYSLGERWMILAIAIYLICVMIIITFIDFAYRIIPDSITYSGIILAPFVSMFFPYFHTGLYFTNTYLSYFCASLFGILVGGGSLYLVGVIGKFLFKKEAMGLGDVKLMALVGGWIGWEAALLIFLLACLLGTVIGIINLIVTKDHYIPFGPYLALGTLITLLYKQEIIHILLYKWPEFISQCMGMPSPI